MFGFCKSGQKSCIYVKKISLNRILEGFGYVILHEILHLMKLNITD